MNNMTDTVKHLIIINVLVFLAANFAMPDLYNSLSLHSFNNSDFKWYQLFTHMFMHAKLPTIMHIGFNMYALYSFGSVLEHFWGRNKFLFFYITCGIGAGLIYNLVNYYTFQSGISVLLENGIAKSEIIDSLNSKSYNSQWLEIISESKLNSLFESYYATAVGASGAIYGLLVAYGFMFPNAELGFMFIPVPVKAKYFIPGIILIDLFFGLKGQSIFGYGGTGIAHFAHIGGALFGFIIMWSWRNTKYNRN